MSVLFARFRHAVARAEHSCRLSFSGTGISELQERLRVESWNLALADTREVSVAAGHAVGPAAQETMAGPARVLCWWLRFDVDFTWRGWLGRTLELPEAFEGDASVGKSIWIEPAGRSFHSRPNVSALPQHLPGHCSQHDDSAQCSAGDSFAQVLER